MRLFYTKDFTKFVLSSQGAISTIPLLHLRAVTNFGVAFFLFNKLIKNDVKAAARTDVLHDQVSPFKLCFIIKSYSPHPTQPPQFPLPCLKLGLGLWIVEIGDSITSGHGTWKSALRMSRKQKVIFRYRKCKG
ncbi:hypothetical protein ACS0TY_036809 [Phlomoides rotata]